MHRQRLSYFLNFDQSHQKPSSYKLNSESQQTDYSETK